jgi:hypothetical protein
VTRLPGDDGGEQPPGGPRRGPTTTRIIIWIAVAGVALYLIISGIVGVVTKGG